MFANFFSYFIYLNLLTQLNFSEFNKLADKYVYYLGIKSSSTKVPWCAGFVGYNLQPYNLDTGSALARSYLYIGTPTQNPKIGDLVIFSRNKSNILGHVAFFIEFNKDKSLVKVLGGDQKNKVSKLYFKTSSILSIRRLNYKYKYSNTIMCI